MLVTWDTGVSAHESALVVMANMANTGKTVQVVRWSSRKRRVVQAPAESATGEMIFPGPRFPQKSPQMGEGQFFPTLPQKMPILFHSGNKRHFKLCSKSVSNYQNQLVEAEKLFKKSHIFAWFHCSKNTLVWLWYGKSRIGFRLHEKSRRTPSAYCNFGISCLISTIAAERCCNQLVHDQPDLWTVT